MAIKLEDLAKGVKKTRAIRQTAQPYIEKANENAQVAKVLKDARYSEEYIRQVLESGDAGTTAEALEVARAIVTEDNIKAYSEDREAILRQADGKSLEGVVLKYVPPQEDEDDDRGKLRKVIYGLENTLEAAQQGDKKARAALGKYAEDFRKLYVSDRVEKAAGKAAEKLKGYSEETVKMWQKSVMNIEAQIAIRDYAEKFGDEEAAVRGYSNYLKGKFDETFPEETRQQEIADYSIRKISKLEPKEAVELLPELKVA